jgi:hypothetical protein
LTSHVLSDSVESTTATLLAERLGVLAGSYEHIADLAHD